MDLDLGRFTVIVGASSSGKSALVRSLRAVASNVRGTAALTRGTTSAAISVRTATHTVTLEHSGGAWRYRVTSEAAAEQTYTKLAGAVPPDVTAALGIRPVLTGAVSLNFAGQFDAPYLLSESGAAVARVLGELTNVDTILSAVREANRRRAAAAAALKVREADRVNLAGNLARFAGLPARIKAVQRAEDAAQRAQELKVRTDRLESALTALEVAESVLDRATLPTLPDLGRLTEAHVRYLRLGRLLNEQRAAQAAVADADRGVAAATHREHGSAEAFTDALVTAGQCPLCGQAVTK